jgi:hypothetical protein
MSFNTISLKKADFKYWNKISKVTLNEFIFLAAGCSPEPLGLYKFANNATFIEYYEKVLRYSKDSLNSEVNKVNIEGRETKYLALDLIKWAKQLGIKVNSFYKPKVVFISKNNCLITPQSSREDFALDTQEDKNEFNANTEDELYSKLKSSYLFEPMLLIQQKYYSEEITLKADFVLSEIMKLNSDKIIKSKKKLSKNDCELIHNLLRIVNGLKK